MKGWSKTHDQYGKLVWAAVYRLLGNEPDSLDCCQDLFAVLIQKSPPKHVETCPAFLRWLATRRTLN